MIFVTDYYRFLIITVTCFASWAAYSLRFRRIEKARLGDYSKYEAFNYTPTFSVVLFIYFVILLVISINSESLLGGMFITLVLTGFYYIILYFSMPLLRKFIEPYTCSMLWLVVGILLQFFYVGVILFEPVVFIRFPKALLPTVYAIWLIPAFIITIYLFISHFFYRSRLKKGRLGEASTDIQRQWQHHLRAGGINRNIPVYITNQLSSPVTLGLFRITMVLYLPMRKYTEKELDLIMRHEVYHIIRGDTQNKLVMGLISALNWFNPLVFLSSIRASEDFELSCDEEVLYIAWDCDRRQYAELILSSADSSKGFSTCLSARAKSLKYRLQSILNPKKKNPGTFIFVLALFGALTAGSALVGVADSADKTISDYFDGSENLAVQEGYIDGDSFYSCDDDIIMDYVLSLPIHEVVVGMVDLSAKDPTFIIWLKSGGSIRIYDGFASAAGTQFILDTDIDEDFLKSHIDFSAPDPDPAPVANMRVTYSKSYIDKYNFESEFSDFRLICRLISAIRGGEDISEDIFWGKGDISPGGISGIEKEAVESLELSFNYEQSGKFSVKISNWDNTDSQTLYFTEIPAEIPLPTESSHIEIEASFKTNRDTSYVVKFYFDLDYVK